MHAAGFDRRLLELIRSSLLHRRALCELVLAVYRVELTSMFRRMASDGVDEGDVERIQDLASRIATAATTASMAVVQREALRLQRSAMAAHEGGKREEGAMFAAGLDLIDRILATAKAERAIRAAQGDDALN